MSIFKNFGTNVSRSATPFEQHFRIIDKFGKSKIYNLDFKISFVSEHYVFWLDVTVNNINRMEIYVKIYYIKDYLKVVS